MSRPNITTYDVFTNITSVREMTDEEYEALLASGWTPEGEATDGNIE